LLFKDGSSMQLINQGAKLRPPSVLAKGMLQQLARRSKKQVSDFVDVGVTK
jgi:hypothetical protein